VGILPYLLKSQSIIALHYRTALSHALTQSIACITACNIALRFNHHQETDTIFLPMIQNNVDWLLRSAP
jgi:hypothetical protein